MRSLAGDHIREIRLDVRHQEMDNEAMPVHKFVDSSQWDQESWFSILMHVASFPNLAVLQLLGGLVICPQFFRGIIEHTGTPFPSLIEFELQFAPDTADGRWFYDPDEKSINRAHADRQRARRYRSDSSGSEDNVRVYGDGPSRIGVVKHNRFRLVPATTTFLPFLMDAAEAVSRIPSLRKFILKQGHIFSSRSCVFELWYLKAGTPRSQNNPPGTNAYKNFPMIPGDAAYLKYHRLYWRVDGWKPWGEVQAAWTSIAGPDAKIVFLEEHKWGHYGGNNSLQTYDGQF